MFTVFFSVTYLEEEMEREENVVLIGLELRNTCKFN